ncbi:hypothetical protein BKA83DRAFT_4341847 [Pisolithus microcarpus]|nr:hypothetical protein BKA83DRAFT_4341847 [Pisolithus microcarpus]
MSLTETATSVSGAFDSIPIIDIGHASTHEERVALAQQTRDACVNVGFFYIKNHGIPEETIDTALSAMKTYFSFPLETKMKLHHRQGTLHRGYEPLFDSNIDPANRGDLYEAFVIGWDENPWPSEPIEFREALTKYYHAAISVGKFLYRLFALALDLPETYFDDKFKRSPVFRALHYPPQTGPEDDRIVGIGAHSDFECFTILWQEPDIQALQVLNSKNQWINATPIPGTLVINIGDLLSRWTNDMFRSTVHRAINRSGVRRYSMPLFIGVEPHVEVEPFPSCVSPDRPAKYEKINSREYVRKRLRAMYHQGNGTSGDPE